MFHNPAVHVYLCAQAVMAAHMMVLLLVSEKEQDQAGDWQPLVRSRRLSSCSFRPKYVTSKLIPGLLNKIRVLGRTGCV